MNTSTTLPNAIQIRPSRLAGLLIAVAILTGVTTWSVSQATTESHSRSSPKSDLVSSPGPATKAYGDSVAALDAEERAAISGNLSPTQQYARAVRALSPERQAAIWGNVSPTQQYARTVMALSAEQQAAIYGNVSPTHQYVNAVTDLTPEQRAAIYGNVQPNE
jgi:hypothetical protein